LGGDADSNQDRKKKKIGRPGGNVSFPDVSLWWKKKREGGRLGQRKSGKGKKEKKKREKQTSKRRHIWSYRKKKETGRPGKKKNQKIKGPGGRKKWSIVLYNEKKGKEEKRAHCCTTNKAGRVDEKNGRYKMGKRIPL